MGYPLAHPEVILAVPPECSLALAATSTVTGSFHTTVDLVCGLPWPFPLHYYSLSIGLHIAEQNIDTLPPLSEKPMILHSKCHDLNGRKTKVDNGVKYGKPIPKECVNKMKPS